MPDKKPCPSCEEEVWMEKLETAIGDKHLDFVWCCPMCGHEEDVKTGEVL